MRSNSFAPSREPARDASTSALERRAFTSPLQAVIPTHLPLGRMGMGSRSVHCQSIRESLSHPKAAGKRLGRGSINKERAK